MAQAVFMVGVIIPVLVVIIGEKVRNASTNQRHDDKEASKVTKAK